MLDTDRLSSITLEILSLAKPSSAVKSQFNPATLRREDKPQFSLASQHWFGPLLKMGHFSCRLFFFFFLGFPSCSLEDPVQDALHLHAGEEAASLDPLPSPPVDGTAENWLR